MVNILNNENRWENVMEDVSNAVREVPRVEVIMLAPGVWEGLARDAGCDDVGCGHEDLSADITNVTCESGNVWMDNGVGSGGIRANVNCTLRNDLGLVASSVNSRRPPTHSSTAHINVSDEWNFDRVVSYNVLHGQNWSMRVNVNVGMGTWVVWSSVGTKDITLVILSIKKDRVVGGLVFLGRVSANCSYRAVVKNRNCVAIKKGNVVSTVIVAYGTEYAGVENNVVKWNRRESIDSIKTLVNDWNVSSEKLHLMVMLCMTKHEGDVPSQ
jgi:hypothetical protein